jgi:hypothetical protein
MLKSSPISTDVAVGLLYLVFLLLSVIYMLDKAGILNIIPTFLR